jgi:hypothetical protein
MDLLTALMHEVGHLLGLNHNTAGVMQETLASGTRLSPTAADLNAAAETVIAPRKAPTVLTPVWAKGGRSHGHTAGAGNPLALGDSLGALANADALAQAFALAAERSR